MPLFAINLHAPSPSVSSVKFSSHINPTVGGEKGSRSEILRDDIFHAFRSAPSMWDQGQIPAPRLARLSSPYQTGEACQLALEEFPLQGRGDTLTLTLCIKSNTDTPSYLKSRFPPPILLSPFTNAFRGHFTRLIHQRIWEMFRLLCQVIKQCEHYQNPFPSRCLSNFVFYKTCVIFLKKMCLICVCML